MKHISLSQTLPSSSAQVSCLSPHFPSSVFTEGALLLLLSRFSRVRLCATPETAARQAPQSLGLARQEHWSHFPLQCMKVNSESEVTQSSPTLRDPMNCSPPGPSVHGIFQARVPAWGAIAFSRGSVEAGRNRALCLLLTPQNKRTMAKVSEL